MPWWGLILIGFMFVAGGAIQWGRENIIERIEYSGTHTYEYRDLEGNTVLVTKNPVALNTHYKLVKKEQ